MFHKKQHGLNIVFVIFFILILSVILGVILSSQETFFNDKESSTFQTSIDFMLDPSPNKKVVTMLDLYHIFFMYSLGQNHQSVANIEDIMTLQQTRPVIAYHTEAEKFMFQVLMKSYKIMDDTYILEKIDQDMFKYSVICHIGPPSVTNPLFLSLDKSKNLTIIEYNNVNKPTVAFFIPFIRTRGIDIKTLMPNQSKVMLTLSSFVIDTLSYTKTRENKAIHDNNRTQSQNELNNFYELFFSFVNRIEAYVNDERITFSIEEPISIIQHVLNKYDEFKVIIVAHISLCKLNDIVVLSNQLNQSYNGRYVCTNITTTTTTLQSMLSLSFYDNFDLVETGKINVLTGHLKKGHEIISGTNNIFWFTDLDASGTIINDFALVHFKLDTSFKYECIGDASIKTQQSCESEFDGLGRSKRIFVWDKRCTKNTECPFYNAKKNRGTCNDNGYCEMPLGVTRVGFRRYQGKALCHDCNASDYAFAYDYLARSHKSIESFIPDYQMSTSILSLSPKYERNDHDFQHIFFSEFKDQFTMPQSYELKHIKPESALFLNHSCQALLDVVIGLASYQYKFGKSDRYGIYNNFVYFDAIVCIHAPSKEKAKVIRYDCRMDAKKSYAFANIITIGSISEDQL